MDFIWNRITDWLKEILVGGIMGNLQGLFDQVNTQVAGIAGQVGHDAAGMERRRVQHDPQPVRSGNSAHRGRDPRHRDDDGAFCSW